MWKAMLLPKDTWALLSCTVSPWQSSLTQPLVFNWVKVDVLWPPTLSCQTKGLTQRSALGRSGNSDLVGDLSSMVGWEHLALWVLAWPRRSPALVTDPLTVPFDSLVACFYLPFWLLVFS